jgi:RNA polymerase sigma factor (sigma-70 family)
VRAGSRSVDAGSPLGISLDDLYRLHAAHALRVARSITHNPEDAADAVAEAFTGILGAVSSGRLTDAESFRPYLVVATRNAAIDIVRRSGRVQPTDQSGSLDAVATAAGPSDRLLAGEDRDLVAGAFATLPPRWRAVLWLTEVERLPPRDVAPLLGLTANNVAQLAARARSRLRRQYVQSHVRNHARGDCAEATELLGGLVAGALTAAQAERVRDHLEGCAACRARRSEVEDLGLALRRATLPAALAGLRRRRPWRRHWPFGRLGARPRVWAAAAAVDPAAASQLDVAVRLGSSPAVQQVAAAVVGGLLVLGVGTAVVRHDDPPAPAAAPAVTQTAGALPSTTVAVPTPDPTTPTTAPAPVSVASAPAPPAAAAAFVPRGPLATAQPSTVAHALGSPLAVFDAPGATAATRVLPNPRSSGAPLVLLVVDQRPGWLQVLLPVRPNGSTGWIRAGDVSLTTHDFRIVVELAAHRITAYQGTAVLLSEAIGVGTAEAPTPGGRYYVTELFQPLDSAGRLDPGGPYGPYAYGLSGYSDVLYDFAGGDGQFGIHGTNEPALLGQDVSHGCIRMSNAGITRLAGILPLGVPVDILP